MSSTTDSDLVGRHRAWLEDELTQTKARIAGLEHALGDIVSAARESASDDEHDDDAGAMALERSQTEGLLESAHDHLDEIHAAMARLEAGTYGICERCGRPIAEARLEARPVARLCIQCAAARR